MCGVVVGFSWSVPSLASVSAISFSLKLECARTLWMWVVCEVQYICFVMLHLRVCWGDDVVMSGVVCGC